MLDVTYRGINNPFPLPTHTHPNATQTSDGFLSKEDKAKLDGLGGGIGGSFFPKIREVIVSSPSDYVDLLNVVGYKLYLVRWTGVRVSGVSLPSSPSSVQLYLQTGKNSTLYASGGDYGGGGSRYPFSGSGIQNTTAGAKGDGFVRLKWLNQATKKTMDLATPAGAWSFLFGGDEDMEDPALAHTPVRAAATEENRVRFLLASGSKFTAGRFTVYGVGG